MSLTDVLKSLGWSKYLTSAYSVLVESGSLKANDLAIKADIPPGRIYSVLENLEKKGWILKTGKRPTYYHAQHPRSVIEAEIEKIKQNAEDALQKIEEEFEYISERNDLKSNSSWIISGMSGFVAEFRRAVLSSVRSILILDPDLNWINRKDIEILSKQNESKEVKILTSNISKESVKKLQAENINIKEFKEISESYYIFDDSNVIFRLRVQEECLLFNDNVQSAFLVQRFHHLYNSINNIGNLNVNG